MNDRYQPIQTLDATQYGQVIVAEDQLLGQKCVLKTIYKQSGDIHIHQWRMEVRVLSEIQNRHIPKWLDVNETATAFTLVETYIPGIDLVSWNRQLSLFKRRKRNQIFIEWMVCIQSVHEAGYLYVDIKPSNCLVFDEHLYLIDFNSCIEIGEHQIISASKENMNALIQDNKSKGIVVDLNGLLYIHKLLFPFSMRNILLKQLISWSLIQTTKQLQSWFIGMIRFKRVMSILITLLLSVFFLTHSLLNTQSAFQDYQKNPNVQSFFRAYQDRKQEESYIRLYEWIENDWIVPSLWKEEKVALYVLKESLNSKDPELITYTVSKIPISILYQNLELFLETKVDIHEALSEKEIDECLSNIGKSLSFGHALHTFLQLKTVLSEKQVKELSKKVSGTWNDWHEQEVCLYVEFSLFQMAKGQKGLQIPEKMAQKWEQNKTFKEMYSLWKEGQ